MSVLIVKNYLFTLQRQSAVTRLTFKLHDFQLHYFQTLWDDYIWGDFSQKKLCIFFGCNMFR